MYGDDLLGDPQNIEEIVEVEEEEALYLEANEDDEATATEQNEGAEATSEAEAAGTTKEVKKRRAVLHPQPKLNPERLTGPRGIATLEDAFKDFKFLGKGYEKEDLDQVMKRLEHWCHRLFPRFQFDDCLEKIETLGHKKPVMTYVKKIRMGMVTAEEAMILHEEVEGDENEPALDDQPPIDEFDALISQQLSHMQTIAPTPPPQPSSGLTAEQRERMLRNRLLAEERRLARMKMQREKEAKTEENCSQSAVSEDSGKEVESEMSHSTVFVESDESSCITKLTVTSQDGGSDVLSHPQKLLESSLEINKVAENSSLENLPQSKTSMDEESSHLGEQSRELKGPSLPRAVSPEI